MLSLHRKIRLGAEFEGIDPPDIDIDYTYEMVEIRRTDMSICLYDSDRTINENIYSNIYFNIISETAKKFPEYVFSIVNDSNNQVVNILNRDKDLQLNEYKNYAEYNRSNWFSLGLNPVFRIYKYIDMYGYNNIDWEFEREHHTQRGLGSEMHINDGEYSKGDHKDNVVWAIYDRTSRREEMINRIFPELLRQTERELLLLYEVKNAYNLGRAFKFEKTQEDIDFETNPIYEDDKIDEIGMKRLKIYNDQERKKGALRAFAVHQYLPQMRTLTDDVRRRFPIDHGKPLDFVRGMRQWFN